MDNLEGFASEYSKPFKICFELLAKCNISIYNKTQSVWSIVRSVFMITFCITFYFSLLVSFKKFFTGELGFLELAKILPIVIVITQTTVKGAVIISNLSKARRIINELGSMWKSTGLTERQVTCRGVMLKRLNLCNAVFYWMNMVAAWQYLSMPLLETLFRTFVLGQDKMIFPFVTTLPFDASQNWMVYLVTYLYESWTMFHILYLYLGVEFLMITLCSHLATEFEILREEMLHAKQTEPETAMHQSTNPGKSYVGELDTISYDKDESADDIKNIRDNYENDGEAAFGNGFGLTDVIKRHKKLILLSQILDDIFNRVIFFNLLFPTITICFFGFIAKISRDPADMANNFGAVIASIIPIYNLCYYADMLSRASAGVADSAYHNLWYEGDVRYQKSIIFIILRSQRPCCLTSMGYAQVTLNTFTKVLSTTWSYFSLAISMYEADK